MRLKSLKLAGFKSFANPTTFTFKHGITAIVGPNGCGKSNVIDAIRWVLGETSAKQLRGGAMSDVIFAGVEGRAAKSLASVELTFEHTQDEKMGIRHSLNIYQELTLRRQVTREGKSDYFINGQRVRRRDVVDVFLGTGLGSRSYAVIEQGMIGRIVESGPLELRAFIEEAAGVSRYQARRIETQKQLDETTENLARLHDLQGELKKQHKNLARQAESAKKYHELNAKLDELNKTELIKRIYESWQYLTQKESEQQKSDEVLMAFEQKVNQAKKELDTHSQKIAESNWLKDDARDKYHNARMAEQTAEHNFYTLNQTLSQNEDKLSRIKTQQHEHLAILENGQKEVAQIESELEIIVPKITQGSKELSEIQENLVLVEQDFGKIRQEHNQQLLKKQELENTVRFGTAQADRLQNNLQKWQIRFDELQKNQTQIADDTQDLERISLLKREISYLKDALDIIDEESVDKASYDSDLATAQLWQTEITTLEKRHASLMGEYETLHKLVHRPKSSEISNNSDDKFAVHPTLKDDIKLSKKGEQYSAVLDLFLAFWLDGKILDKNNGFEIFNAIHSLPQKNQSTAILTTSSPQNIQANGLIAVNELIASPKLAMFDGVYLLERSCKNIDDGAISKLQDEWLDEINQGVVILTDTGWILGAFGAVHVSKFGAKSDLLSQKTEHNQRLIVLEDELNHLEEELDQKRLAMKKLQSSIDGQKIALEEARAKRDSITTNLHKAEREMMTLTAKIDGNALKRQAFLDQKNTLEFQKTELQAEITEQQKQLDAFQEDLKVHLPHLSATQNAMTSINAKMEELGRKYKQQQDNHANLQLQQNTLLQKKTHLTGLMTLSEKSSEQNKNEILQLSETCESLNERLPELERVFKEAKSVSANLKLVSEEHEAVAKTLSLMQGKLQENLANAHADYASAQAQIAQISADVAVGRSRVGDLGDEMKKLDECFNLSAQLSDFAKAPADYADGFADNQAQIAEVKRQIEKLGAVNLAAAAELAELEERVSPMDTQINDITASMKKLQDAISAIDDKTRMLFMTTLDAVNRDLDELFVKVFGGGQASLTLMNDDNLSKSDKWRAGLVLMAQPKGKKNSRLAVLSGGEKTLTALSLIFAIFKQHPAPFCVLDEVDAPLDDANVGRFTSLIHELADSVQFIFISHNKLAMQTADELKGITMPTAGISSLVTVNLEEAQKYIESKPSS